MNRKNIVVARPVRASRRRLAACGLLAIATGCATKTDPPPVRLADRGANAVSL